MEVNNAAAARHAAILSDFKALDSWEQRYRHIISLGKTLPGLDAAHKRPEFEVEACQSRTWILKQERSVEPQDEGIHFMGDSEALIVKGLMVLLFRLYSGLGAEQVLKVQPDFIKSLGFQQGLSMGRVNGLGAMVRHIKLLALKCVSIKDS